MTSVARLALFLSFAGAISCSDYAATKAVAPDAPLVSSTSEPLTIDVTGPTLAATGEIVKLSASVSGGVPPYYLHWWATEKCYFGGILKEKLIGTGEVFEVDYTMGNADYTYIDVWVDDAAGSNTWDAHTIDNSITRNSCDDLDGSDPA